MTKNLDLYSDEVIETIIKLEALHDMIPTIPDKEFNMRHWWQNDDYVIRTPGGLHHECQTHGCVIGHGIHKRILTNLTMHGIQHAIFPFALIREKEFPIIPEVDLMYMFGVNSVREDGEEEMNITKPAVMQRIKSVINILMGGNS